jgi:hypothetical protein
MPPFEWNFTAKVFTKFCTTCESTYYGGQT